MVFEILYKVQAIHLESGGFLCMLSKLQTQGAEMSSPLIDFFLIFLICFISTKIKSYPKFVIRSLKDKVLLLLILKPINKLFRSQTLPSTLFVGLYFYIKPLHNSNFPDGYKSGPLWSTSSLPHQIILEKH